MTTTARKQAPQTSPPRRLPERLGLAGRGLLGALIAGVLGAGVLGLPGGCSSPAAQPRGDAIVLRLYDARSGVRLELSSEANPDLADVYSVEKQDAALKLLPEPLFADLLRNLQQLRFDELSRPGAPPPVAAGAGPGPSSGTGPAPKLGVAPAGARSGDGSGLRGWVEVQKNGESRSLVVPETGATPDELEAFAAMKLIVNDYYMHVGALQHIDNPEGAELLRKSRYRSDP